MFYGMRRTQGQLGQFGDTAHAVILMRERRVPHVSRSSAD